eukprot:12182290-Alexandrium_andersonii.AAC.1
MSASLVGSEMCIRDSLGPAQFQVRTCEAFLQFTHGGLQIEADCSTDWPWACLLYTSDAADDM